MYKLLVIAFILLVIIILIIPSSTTEKLEMREIEDANGQKIKVPVRSSMGAGSYVKLKDAKITFNQ